MVVVLPLTRTVANTITRVVVRMIRLGSPSLYSAANANAIAPLRPVQFLFEWCSSESQERFRGNKSETLLRFWALWIESKVSFNWDWSEIWPIFYWSIEIAIMLAWYFTTHRCSTLKPILGYEGYVVGRLSSLQIYTMIFPCTETRAGANFLC